MKQYILKVDFGRYKLGAKRLKIELENMGYIGIEIEEVN